MQRLSRRPAGQQHRARSCIAPIRKEALEGDLKFIENAFEPGLRKIAASEGGLASEAAPPEDALFGENLSAPKPAAATAHREDPYAQRSGGGP